MQNIKNHFPHRMTFTYLLALSIIALLSIASFFTLRKVISTQKTSASVINVTNRQRFLAQNVAIYALCLANAKNATDIETSKQDLLATIIEMEKAHKGLICGDPSLKLTGKQSPHIKAFYRQKPVELDKKIYSYFTEARNLSTELDSELSPQNEHVSNILNKFAAELIVSLDIVINQLQSESEQDNRKLQLLEFSVLCVTLFALIIVAWYIFRPMTERIKRDIDEQRRAQRRTNVQYAVTRVLAESSAIAETIQALLQSLGETLDYNVGVFWGMDDQNGSLFLKETWQNCLPAKDAEELFSGLTSSSPEKGLPGVIATNKAPVGIPDITKEPIVCRHYSIAIKHNLHGAVAFSVVSEQEILGVFEFFSLQKQPVDAYLPDCLNTLGYHIGQFFKRKESEEQIAHLAIHDTLTNLFNRRRFNEELESCLTQSNRYGAYGALLFIDLDNFKNVNDTYGHQTGDELLVNISTVLKQRLRKSDVLGRLGGDEFAVLLYHVNGEQAETISEQMVETISQNGKYTKNNYTNVTASIGVALFPDHSEVLDGLIACADHAMYRAKEDGRNRFCMYSNNT